MLKNAALILTLGTFRGHYSFRKMSSASYCSRTDRINLLRNTVFISHDSIFFDFPIVLQLIHRLFIQIQSALNSNSLEMIQLFMLCVSLSSHYFFVKMVFMYSIFVTNGGMSILY